jgi:chromosome partitioning protein
MSSALCQHFASTRCFAAKKLDFPQETGYMSGVGDGWHSASIVQALCQELAMPTVCITNQKGGCGKTMTAINLGAGLARQDQRVLLVDLDPQGPVAAGLGAALPADLLPIAPAIQDRVLDRIVVPTPTPGLWVIPSDASLDAQALYKKPPTTLRRAVRALAQPFDFVLLDTPPNLDLVTLNAMMAADWLILPCDVDKESVLSLRRTLEVVFEYVEDRDDVVLEDFYRVLVTMVDPRSRVMNRWFDTQLAPLAPVLFTTRIHRADAFKKARTQGQSIFDYVHTRRARSKESHRAAAEYTCLTEEVIAHATRRAHHPHPVPAAPTAKRGGKGA